LNLTNKKRLEESRR